MWWLLEKKYKFGENKCFFLGGDFIILKNRFTWVVKHDRGSHF